MGKENNLTDFLTDVANVIREKKGTSDLINPQNFSEEIKNLPSGSSPFAVDFGEEIATGNPAIIGALQEDIDYYNEVVRSIESGERTQNDYLSGNSEFGKEFRRRIAWWPKIFTIYRQVLSKSYTNLKGLCRPELKFFDGYYTFKDNGSMQSCIADFSTITNAKQMFENCGSLKAVDLQNAPITNANSLFRNCFNLQRIDGLNLSEVVDAGNMLYGCFSLTGKIEIILPKATNVGSILEGSYMLEEAVVDIPKITSLQYSLRGLHSLKKLTINMPSMERCTYFLYGSNGVEELYISGLKTNLDVADKTLLTVESVKYICDNCQARADGAAYTLTLHSTVKQNFMNKCTEGHEEYDADYAVSLASANEKGLTIA